MSIRPIKRLLQAKPTIEGAGVRLRRAFGFGNTSEFDPFLLFDDFRNENPEDYLAGFPWHPHRGIETITYVLARLGDARRQPRQQRRARRRRRAVDDGGERHPAPGDAEGRRPGTHARLPAVGEPPVVAQDDDAALPGRRGPRYPRDPRRRRDTRARRMRRVLGAARTGGGHRCRPALPGRLGSAVAAQDACRWRRRAMPSPTSSRAAARSATRRRRRACSRRRPAPTRRPFGSTMPATGRWCSSTAATRSRCRRARRASGSCSSPASRWRSPWPGTARSS